MLTVPPDPDSELPGVEPGPSVRKPEYPTTKHKRFYHGLSLMDDVMGGR